MNLGVIYLRSFFVLCIAGFLGLLFSVAFLFLKRKRLRLFTVLLSSFPLGLLLSILIVAFGHATLFSRGIVIRTMPSLRMVALLTNLPSGICLQRIKWIGRPSTPGSLLILATIAVQVGGIRLSFRGPRRPAFWTDNLRSELRIAERPKGNNLRVYYLNGIVSFL